MRTTQYARIGDFGGQEGFNPKDSYVYDPARGKAARTTYGVTQSDNALERFIEQMYQQFTPQEVTYDARSEEEIRNSIAAWLQPSYDEAISDRKEQTLLNNANLDADAISRGMGASTYLSDVKNRQQSAEASDIASMRADYGATLAKNVFDSVSAEKEHVLEVNEFNAQQRQQAYELAYQAALVLYEQFLKDPKKGVELFTPLPRKRTGNDYSTLGGTRTTKTARR